MPSETAQSHRVKGLAVVETPASQALAGSLWVGNRRRQSRSGAFLEVVSPATGAVVGYTPLATRGEAAEAVEMAAHATTALRRLSVWDRSRLCMRVADRIDAQREALGRLLCLEQGKPYHAEALPEVDGAVLAFRNAAEQIKWLETASFPLEDPAKRAYSFLQPKGVFAVITPWNVPLAQPCLYHLAPGLATGNAMVWVPAPTTSLIANALMDCFAEADLPEGSINLVSGEGNVVGDAAVTHYATNAVAFTGSTATGHRIASRSAGKTLLMELGGNGPTLVLVDADLDAAARKIAAGCFFNAGQICTSTERVLVDDRVHDEFVERLTNEAHMVTLGDPFAPETRMGPLNNEPGAQKVEAHLEDARAAGAQILVGGARASGFPTRLHFQPTVVVDLPGTALLNTDETFGPVAPVLRFRSRGEADQLIAASPYGLFASVFTRDMSSAIRWAEALRAGVVNINDRSSYWEPSIPAGGASGSASGNSRTGGRHTLLDMSDLKTLTIDINDGAELGDVPTPPAAE